MSTENCAECGNHLEDWQIDINLDFCSDECCSLWHSKQPKYDEASFDDVKRIYIIPNLGEF